MQLRVGQDPRVFISANRLLFSTMDPSDQTKHVLRHRLTGRFWRRKDEWTDKKDEWTDKKDEAARFSDPVGALRTCLRYGLTEVALISLSSGAISLRLFT